MVQVYPNEGLVMQLLLIATGQLRFHLFTNDVDPDRDTVLTDLTEAAWGGYAVHDLDETDFTLNGVAGDTGFIVAALIAFANTSGGTVSAYGFYVTDVAETTLLAVTRFDSAPVSKLNGQSYLVTPAWGDYSEEPL